jgi:hypothetical protein
MTNTHHIAPPALSRRAFLRGAGVALTLPMLSAMRTVVAAGKQDVPRRMVLIETNMGVLPEFFFPEKAGKEYSLTPYLKRLADFRNQLTVLSGVSLPGVTGGHAAEKCFLTGTPHPERGGFRNGVSLDQVAAEHIGDRTRYPALVLGVGNEGQTLSYTRSGAPIPIERSPRKLFEKLFLQGNAAEVAAKMEQLAQGRSTLDFVNEQAKRLNGSLCAEDRQRLQQYFTSVRDLEKRLASAQEWEKKPKPKTTAKPPEDIKDHREFAKQMAVLFDVIKLALETDSSRLVSVFVDTTVIHNITHHGNRPEVIAELRAKEESQFDSLASFLKSLAQTKEQEATLLDRTMVLYGTCMGSANSHSNTNLPVLLAGGGFKHGQHLAFDTKNNYPLTNLYVSMLQRLGLEIGEFSSGKSTMRGLEMA